MVSETHMDLSCPPVDKDAKAIQIADATFISSLAFLPDGNHLFGGGFEGKVRCWQVEDGTDIGQPMNAGAAILGLAVSQDGKWIVSGTEDGRVAVWDAATRSIALAFQAHLDFPVETVDVSPDGTRIVTGAHDATACIWSLSTGERLIGPLHHISTLAMVKYSFDGLSLATATCDVYSIRIYRTRDGHLLTNIPANGDAFDKSLCWSNNDKYLFALAEGKIKCFDVFSGMALSEWPIHSSGDLKGIILANNGKFIAAAANSSVSFWDTATHEQIGPVIEHEDVLLSLAVSPNYKFATSGVKSVILRRLQDILPPHYCDDIPAEWLNSPMKAENVNPEEHVKTLLSDIRILRVQHETSQEKIAKLENTVQELRDEFAEFQRVASQEKNDLFMIIESLRARDESSEKLRVLKHSLEALVRDICIQVSDTLQIAH